MGSEFIYGVQLLLKEIFNRDHYNLPQLDGERCAGCGGIIVVEKKTRLTKKQKEIALTDRSECVDCDPSIGNEKRKLQRYHNECWRKELQKQSV